MINTNRQPLLFAVGVNHQTASLEVREKVYLHEAEQAEFIAKLRRNVSESMILSTCNRTEIYGVADSANINLDFFKEQLIKFKNAEESVGKEHFFAAVSCAACRQFFNVATSLDSKIVGDDQILQQLKDAYALAQKQNSAGKILNQLAQTGFRIGRKTYTETNIHRGAISVSLAAVELAVEIFGSLKDKNVLIVGAGETARLAAECLLKREVGKIFITNRTDTKAKELRADLRRTDDFAGETVPFSDFKNLLHQTDIVISSTSAEDYVLFERDFAGLNNKILLLDIAVPRDIEPETAKNANVVLKNIDDLHLIVDRNFERRMAELPKVKKIIAEEMGDFLLWYYSLPLLPDFAGRKGKPAGEILEETKQVKEFLLKNTSLFHKLARESRGNADEDLQNHTNLVRELFELKKSEDKGVSA